MSIGVDEVNVILSCLMFLMLVLGIGMFFAELKVGDDK